MDIQGILRYTITALLVAIFVCGCRVIICRLRGNSIDPWKLLLLGYVAALLQITGLRLGLRAWSFVHPALRLRPFYTTAKAWRHGLWPFCYHVIGNTVWFIPWGLLLPRVDKKAGLIRVCLAGALSSLAVETVQYLLGTGVPDIDDLILNTIGALTGYLIYRLIKVLR